MRDLGVRQEIDVLLDGLLQGELDNVLRFVRALHDTKPTTPESPARPTPHRPREDSNVVPLRGRPIDLFTPQTDTD